MRPDPLKDSHEKLRKRDFEVFKSDFEPHEKPHGIRRVSNPATRKDLAARTWGVFWY